MLNSTVTERLLKDCLSSLPLCLTHCKRVRKHKVSGELQLLLGMQGDADKISLLLTAYSSETVSAPFLVLVPVHAPLSRKQFEDSNLLWPVSFHEDKAITLALNGRMHNLVCLILYYYILQHASFLCMLPFSGILNPY